MVAKALQTITRLAKRETADIYVFNAEMSASNVDKLRALVCDNGSRRPNAIVFLTTLGGDPDAAFRFGRCLKSHYTSHTFLIFGPCKSAGTLALVGANAIVYGHFGELGPLDVQLAKPDEVVISSSGLDIFQAVGVITNSAFEAFERYFISIINNSEGNISAKTSAEIARALAIGLFSPMTGQIDPERLGQVQRAINIANAYGGRLDRGNLKPGALDKLVQGYPTHTFVIDLEEAKTIFRRVRIADKLEMDVAKQLPWLRRPGREPFIFDVIKLFMPQETRKGASHAPRSKGKRPASRSAVARTGAGTGNVASIRRDAAGNATPTKEHDNAADKPTGGNKTKGRGAGD